MLGLLMFAVASAWALKTDKDQPINVQADHGDFRDNSKTKKGTGIYTGRVVITQGSITLTGDKATLHTDNGELQDADVTGGPATFEQQPDTGGEVHGVASEITYDAGSNMVTLIDNARLTQGIRLMTADRIHYNTDTQHVVANSGDTHERIHITIPPKVQKPTASPSWAPTAGSSIPTSSVPASTSSKAATASTHTKPAAVTSGTFEIKKKGITIPVTVSTALPPLDNGGGPP